MAKYTYLPTYVFLALKPFGKQFQSTTHSVNARKLLRLSTYHYKLLYFNLNILTFELEYEWTPPQIFFCGCCILQLFCHNVEGAHDINCSQK